MPTLLSFIGTRFIFSTTERRPHCHHDKGLKPYSALPAAFGELNGICWEPDLLYRIFDDYLMDTASTLVKS